MACDCTRCRQLSRALASADAVLRRQGVLPAAAGLAAVLVLGVGIVVGIPVAVAVLLAAAVAGALAGTVILLRPRLEPGADAMAPLAVEQWLCENDDDWPWWVLGGVTAFTGLLLVTSPGLGVPLLVVGGLIAAVPVLRRVLDGCGRLA